MKYKICKYLIYKIGLWTICLFFGSTTIKASINDIVIDNVINDICSYLNRADINALCMVNKKFLYLTYRVPYIYEKNINNQDKLQQLVTSKSALLRLKILKLDNSAFESQNSVNSDMLEDLSPLQYLSNLNYLEIADGFLDPILSTLKFPNSLTELTLQCKYFTQYALKQFVWSLSYLHRLTLNNVDTEDFAPDDQFIKSLPKIKYFILIEPKTMPPLILSQNICHLYISGKYVDKISLQHLYLFPMLKKLKLGPHFTDQSFVNFKVSSTLECLEIECNNLACNTLAKINYSPVLKCLTLVNPKIDNTYYLTILMSKMINNYKELRFYMINRSHEQN